MKSLNKLWALGAGVALILSGCQKDPSSPTDEGGRGVLTIGVAYQPATRALLNDVATGITSFEDRITGFTAYVFDWNTGFLEASATSPDGSAVQVSDVSTASTKRIVVIANGAGISTIPTLTHYDDLADAYVDQANQIFSTSDILGTARGLLMTGENTGTTGLQINESTTNTVNIPVKRIVSKVQLGKISFDPTIPLTEILKFNVTGVSIQRGIGATTVPSDYVNTPVVPYSASGYTMNYHGGYTTTIGGAASAYSNVQQNDLRVTALNLQDSILNLVNGLGLDIKVAGIDLGDALSASNLQSLLDNIAAPLIEVTGLDETLGEAVGRIGGTVADLLSNVINAMWYVLPNDASTTKGTEKMSTMLTLKGSYDGNDYYYPIEINANGGEYIRRNTIYNVNVTFHDLIGTTDPDTPGKLASLTISVTPMNWEGPVIQNTVW